jgi:hypothetical protein
LHTNKIHLKFEEEPISRIGDDRKIRGVYFACVELPNGSIRIHKVATNWVEANFSAESLAVVQCVAKETKQTFRNRVNDKQEFGYLSLSKENNMEKLTVTVKMGKRIDVRQVSKIRYIPPKRVKDANGKNHWEPHKWQGLINVDSSNVGDQVTLTDEWMNENISEEFQDLLIRLRGPNKDVRSFVLIPEGANEHQVKEVVQFPEDAPSARYYEANQSEKRRRCVLSSAASGLHYLGLKHISFFINSMQANQRSDNEAFTMFHKKFKERSTKADRRKYQIIYRPKEGTWNMLIDAPKYPFCLLGIKSMDGKTDHCICVVENWIFDSNFEKALPLTIESLNICASSTDRPTSYAGITRGYLLKKVGSS